MSEVAKWLERIVFLLPSLMGLWNAARSGNTKAELDAQLALTRAIKDRQARETLP